MSWILVGGLVVLAFCIVGALTWFMTDSCTDTRCTQKCKQGKACNCGAKNESKDP